MTFPEFPEFFDAIRGYEPMPWQNALAEHVISHGRLPDAVAVPTGLGKTSAILVHLYALAHDVHLHGPRKRTFPLRVFHAVERRVVVDEASSLAEMAATRINDKNANTDQVLGPVRRALQSLIPEPMRSFEPVVSTATLHGGRRIPHDWLRPVGAQLVCATVTQVASRALFRGVGVSQRMHPMHAAVTGMDRVILVDEPHLSVPAIVALQHAEKVQRDGAVVIGDDARSPVPTVPVGQTVMLGATPPDGVSVDTTLGITDADREHEVAGPRLRAARELVLQRSSRSGDAVLAAALAAAAAEAHQRDIGRDSLCRGGDNGVLVFCNTVSLARAVYEAVAGKVKHATLVHGRMRPGDRTLDGIGRGSVTVTTQALEVGADFDGFEVITQVASLSALIQRAGRCNRRGLLPAATVRVLAAGKLDDGTKAVYGGEKGEAVAVLTALEAITADVRGTRLVVQSL